MNEKLIEKMIIKSFQQYQCNPVSKEDQEMLIKHIQTIIHSNTKIDVYEAVEDIVYDYVTENKIGGFHMETSYFYLMIYLLRVQINLGIMHKVSDQFPSTSVSLLHVFSYASILRFVLLHMLVLTCNVPYFSHMYLIDQLFQKFVSIGPGLIAVT